MRALLVLLAVGCAPHPKPPELPPSQPAVADAMRGVADAIIAAGPPAPPPAQFEWDGLWPDLGFCARRAGMLTWGVSIGGIAERYPRDAYAVGYVVTTHEIEHLRKTCSDADHATMPAELMP